MFQVFVSFRGAKPRGNLLAQFHLLGKPVIEVTAYYEIATPLAGLAMTQRLPFRGAGTASAVTEGLTPPGKIRDFTHLP